MSFTMGAILINFEAGATHVFSFAKFDWSFLNDQKVFGGFQFYSSLST